MTFKIFKKFNLFKKPTLFVQLKITNNIIQFSKNTIATITNHISILVTVTNLNIKYSTAKNITAPTFGGMNATLNPGFYKPGDKIEYTITVSNTGNINAIISDVIINTSGSKDIIYTVKSLEKNAKLSKGTNVRFKIVAEFDRNATAIPVISEKTINMVLVVMQDAGNNPTPIAPEILIQLHNMELCM